MGYARFRSLLAATPGNQDEAIRSVVDQLVREEREACAIRLEVAADAWLKEPGQEKAARRLMNLAMQIRDPNAAGM